MEEQRESIPDDVSPHFAVFCGTNVGQVCSVMSQTVRALVYMHETAKICHRDLKVFNPSY